MSCIPLSDLKVTDQWQSGFLAVLPAIETHARIRFRHLRTERREEAVQETVARACVSYQRLVCEGKQQALRVSTLAEFAVRRVGSGRRVGSRQNSQDVLGRSPRHQRSFQVHSLTQSPPEGEQWQDTLIECRRMLPADMAALRIDLKQWLLRFPQRDQRIIGALADGEATAEVAGRFGLTAGRVSQLRRRYEKDWRVFQGEAPGSN
jgi:hypothetical protein